MAFDGDTLYVAESDAIVKYAWNAGKLGPQETVIDGLPDTDPDGDDVHRWKSVVVGPDHLLYLPLPQLHQRRAWRTSRWTRRAARSPRSIRRPAR